MAGFKPVHALAIIDIETTGLPPDDDPLNFSDVHVLEFAIMICDFDLDPLAGYHEVVKLTQPGLEAIRANEYVANMHKRNGLIADSRVATRTLADVEAEVIAFLKESTSFDRGEFMIGGSGNASYDYPLMKAKMPKLAGWFAYYPSDVGIFRRMSKFFAGGRDVINPVPSSYDGDVKSHRAWDDVKAHHEEYRRFREWVQGTLS